MQSNIQDLTLTREVFNLDVWASLFGVQMRICSMPKCNLKHYGKGYCKKHWGQKYKEWLIENNITCQIESCNNLPLAKNYCHKHYNRQHFGRDPKDNTVYDHRPVIIKRDHALLPLGLNAKDGYAIVDLDFAYLDRYKWAVGNHGYPEAYNMLEGFHRHRLHNVILGINWVDHKNGNKLDNRKSNLRPATHQENMWNCKPYSSTGYKGVYLCNPKAKNSSYCVRISKDRKKYYWGKFKTLVEAVLFYNEKAKELFGEFAYINKIPPQESTDV